MFSSLQPQYPAQGSIVSTPILLGYRHIGIVSDRYHDGKPMIISNSSRAGGVREEPWDTFAQHQPVKVEYSASGLDAFRIVERARSRIGTPYDLIKWNCEHLATHALGKEPQSPQVKATLALAALGCLILGFRGA